MLENIVFGFMIISICLVGFVAVLFAVIGICCFIKKLQEKKTPRDETFEYFETIKKYRELLKTFSIKMNKINPNLYVITDKEMQTFTRLNYNLNFLIMSFYIFGEDHVAVNINMNPVYNHQFTIKTPEELERFLNSPYINSCIETFVKYSPEWDAFQKQGKNFLTKYAINFQDENTGID